MPPHVQLRHEFIAVTVLLSLACLAGAQNSTVPPSSAVHAQVHALKVTILSTMLADQSIGEWGFSALVEADGRRVLVDTGNRPETVLQNAKELGLDLSTVSEVVLTHNHDDHVGGLLTLRRELMKKNRSALSRVHVAKGIFYSRPSGKGEDNAMIAIKPEYEATGGQFIEHDQAEEIFPGGWLTGQFWSRVIFRKTSRYAASTLANSHSLGTD